MRIVYTHTYIYIYTYVFTFFYEMVNFMFQLGWATGYSDIWSNIVLVISLKVFLNEVNIEQCRVKLIDCSTRCGLELAGLLTATTP